MRINEKETKWEMNQKQERYEREHTDTPMQIDGRQVARKELGGNCKKVDMSYRLFLGMYWLDRRRKAIDKEMSQRRPTLHQFFRTA